MLCKTLNNNISYYPFGMLMPGRFGSSATSDYMYGFQGQERDDEVKGAGNSINYKYRMHDPRLGRFFAVDPLTHKYPFYSPYHFSSNSPIVAVELEGLESSVILNYNEGTVVLNRSEDGKTYLITQADVQRMNALAPNTIFPQNGMARDIHAGGSIDATCPDCGGPGGQNLTISLPKLQVTRTERVMAVNWNAMLVRGNAAVPPAPIPGTGAAPTAAGSGSASVGGVFAEVNGARVPIASLDFSDPTRRSLYGGVAANQVSTAIGNLPANATVTQINIPFVVTDAGFQNQVLNDVRAANPGISVVGTTITSTDATLGIGAGSVDFTTPFVPGVAPNMTDGTPSTTDQLNLNPQRVFSTREVTRDPVVPVP